MRFNLSLTPEEVNKALFQCGADAKEGQVILIVSRDRFTEILSRVIEFKEQEELDFGMTHVRIQCQLRWKSLGRNNYDFTKW
jgi:hypothetical protein